MLIIESQDKGLYESLQERDLARQSDLLVNFIQLGLNWGLTPPINIHFTLSIMPLCREFHN